MAPDLWLLYSLMLKSRLFEEAIARLWRDGLISGEMHLGTGEEAVVAGVVANLREGDAMALDHRGTAALLMRGVDPVPLLRELLGHPEGLSGGRGGHMHLFSKELLAASSGIVGAAGPAAAGFALAAQHLRPGTVAVAFFGEGAMNQGMLLESMNLASVWSLPVLYVCKDDGWAITARSAELTAGDLCQRALGLGVPAAEVDGGDASKVWETCHSALERARSGQGPGFVRARCVHLEAHFLGFQLTRIANAPLRQMPEVAVPLARSLLHPGGAGLAERLAGLKAVVGAVLAAMRDRRGDPAQDPLSRAREALGSDLVRLLKLEEEIEQQVDRALAAALAGAPS